MKKKTASRRQPFPEHINFRCSTELKERIEQEAAADDRLPSDWLRLTLERMLLPKKPLK